MFDFITSIFEFLGKFILWISDKDIVNYFPLIVFFAAFVLPFILTLREKEAFKGKKAPAKYRYFLNDPLTWFYKLLLMPVSAFIFANFVKNFPSNKVLLFNLGIIILAAIVLAIIITIDTLRRFIKVKKKGKIDDYNVLNKELGVKKSWHNHWWAWKPQQFQLAAMYNNFLLFPLMFFFTAAALGMIFCLPWVVLSHNGELEETVRDAIQSGNLYVVMTGLGMTFNLLYFRNLYSDLYNKKKALIYIVIYIICAFFGLYALFLVSLEEVMKIVSNLFIHGATLASIFFNNKIKKIFSSI